MFILYILYILYFIYYIYYILYTLYYILHIIYFIYYIFYIIYICVRDILYFCWFYPRVFFVTSDIVSSFPLGWLHKHRPSTRLGSWTVNLFEAFWSCVSNCLLLQSPCFDWRCILNNHIFPVSQRTSLLWIKRLKAWSFSYFVIYVLMKKLPLSGPLG